MSTAEVKSYCRICVGTCGMILTLDEGGRILAIRGDKEHPGSSGYVCVKGLQAPEAHNGPQRLTNALKRMPDGTFQPIALEQALDEIADKLRFIIERDGPDAVAFFDAQFRSAAERQALFRLRPQDGQNGQLINQAGDGFGRNLAAL